MTKSTKISGNGESGNGVLGEAGTARDALCRTMYSRLFTLIVARINEAIKVLYMIKVSHFEQFKF